MSYQEVAIDQFSGLQLADDPEETGLGAAVDLLNVNVTSRGRLRTRPGTVTFAAANAPTDRVIAVHSAPEGKVLVSGRPDADLPGFFGYVNAYDSAGGLLVTGPAGLSTSFVNIGTPTAGASTYFLRGLILNKWNGTAFSTISGVSGAGLALSPVDKRLAVVDVSPPSGGYSRVKFSGPGTPETFASNDYVDLDPGDGEALLNITTWHDQIFAFKQTKFFVFYGTSVNGNTGTPVFNYRPVRAGIGAIGNISDLSGRSVTSAPDGVYFIASDGIYRTTGDLPVKVSSALDPWFAGETLPLAVSLPPRQPDSIDQSICSDARSVWYRSGGKTFVYDIASQAWTLNDLSVTAVTPRLGDDSLLLGVTGKVVRTSPAYATDDGTAIGWKYRTGLSDLGSPVSKLVKQMQVWGTGTVTASVYTDHGATDAGATALTLGTAPAVTRGQQYYSRQGTFFSLGLSGTGPAIVHRAVLGVAEQRVAGVG